MTTLKTPPPDVLEYLQAVRATLADLPPDERDELMVDVETALLEAAEESERPLAARLGPPQDSAADLRAAAGLEDRRPPVPAGSRLRDALVALVEHPRIVAARQATAQLAPIWWVARALVAYAGIVMLLGARTSIKYPWMPIVGDRALTFAVLAAFVVGSVWLGISQRRGRALLIANAVLALAALPLALGLLSMSSPYSRGEAAGPVVVYSQGLAPQPQGLALDGQPIRNLYPFTSAGRRLHDVLLFDDLGRPVSIGEAQQGRDPNRRVLTTDQRRQVFNTFPILYFEPNSRVIANPDATATPIRVRPIVDAPPLRSRKRP